MERLTHSDEPILNVAIALGFDSQQSFNRSFKRQYGQAPGAWRRSIVSPKTQHLCRTSPSPAGTVLLPPEGAGLTVYKGEKIGIDLIGMCRWDTVRRAFIGMQGSVLDQLD